MSSVAREGDHLRAHSIWRPALLLIFGFISAYPAYTLHITAAGRALYEREWARYRPVDCTTQRSPRAASPYSSATSPLPDTSVEVKRCVAEEPAIERWSRGW